MSRELTIMLMVLYAALGATAFIGLIGYTVGMCLLEFVKWRDRVRSSAERE